MPPTKRPSSPATTTQLEADLHSQVKRVRRNPSASLVPFSEKIDEQQTTAAPLARWLTDLPGGEVYYVPKFMDSAASEEWFKQLNELNTWYHPKLKVYGKEVSQSRSIAAYATTETIAVRYSGHQVNMHYTYPDILSKIQSMVEENLGVKFNHVMLNRYANGKEYIGKHRDTKDNKVIACLSLGAERTFILTPSKNCSGSPRPHSVILQSGSLLVMQGDTQKNWKHEIPKEPKIQGGRISLTFRQLESG